MIDFRVKNYKNKQLETNNFTSEINVYWKYEVIWQNRNGTKY